MDTDRIIASHDGTRLRVRIEGPSKAPAILLSHALGTGLEMWDPVAATLAERYRVIRYDSRGHGGSDAPGGRYALADIGGDALVVLNALGCETATIVGLSMGGMAAMWIGLQASERVTALVLANTTAYIPAKEMLAANIVRARDGGMPTIAQQTLARWFGPSFRADRPEDLAAYEARMGGMAVDGYAGSSAILEDIDLRERLAHISAPTLVIAGAEDASPAIEGGRAMAAAISGAQFALLPMAGHLSAIENPASFEAAVTAFLDGLA